MSFSNKVAIVTGSSSGIGAAIAIKLAEEGAQVVLVARNQEKLQKVANTCAAHGLKPLTVIADMTIDEDVKKVVSDAVKHFGKIDILVNNAGIGTTVRNIEDPNSLEAFDTVMATNLRSVVLITNLAVPYLIESKGNVVNISSIGGIRVFASGFIYGCSKAALDHFGRSIALDLAPKGVRVNNVNPGPVRSDIFVNMGFGEAEAEERFKAYADFTPMKKVSDANEVADLVAFLASDKAKSITGSTYVIDCGSLLK